VRYARSNLGSEHAADKHRVDCSDHRKVQIPPFLALLLASFFVGAMMGMGPLDMVNAIENGIGGTLGFLAAVIGLGTILGKMMEISGAAERIGLTLQRCRWLSADVIMVLVGLICGITLFVEVGVVLLIPLAFSIAKKTNTSLLKLAIPLCTALMAVHCVVPPHPAALFVANKLGADIGSVIVYGLLVGLMASLIGGPLFLKLLGNRLPFKPVPTEFADLERSRGRHPAVAERDAVYRTAAHRPDAGKNRRELNGQKAVRCIRCWNLSATPLPPCLSPSLWPITCSACVSIWA
jgi:gluconate transporter